jgi:alkylation response protein AidB-like acyl-CoA dehydrogenase
MVGGGQKILDLSVEYAKVRVQFDQPIGSYQAIKHKCAQMMLEVEAARSIAYYAAYTIDVGGQEADIASSVSKAYCSEMYRRAAVEAAQIFGAISLTWEHEIHIYLKRAKMNEYTFGDPAFHRECLARELEY